MLVINEIIPKDKMLIVENIGVSDISIWRGEPLEFYQKLKSGQSSQVFNYPSKQDTVVKVEYSNNDPQPKIEFDDV